MQSLKRVNFNMEPDCHALLKSVCVLKRVTVSEFCQDLIAADLERRVHTDPQVRQMVMHGTYPSGCLAYRLQQKIRSESDFE